MASGCSSPVGRPSDVKCFRSSLASNKAEEFFWLSLGPSRLSLEPGPNRPNLNTQNALWSNTLDYNYRVVTSLFKSHLPPLLPSPLQVLYVVEDAPLRPVRLQAGNGLKSYSDRTTKFRWSEKFFPLIFLKYTSSSRQHLSANVKQFCLSAQKSLKICLGVEKLTISLQLKTVGSFPLELQP